MQHILIILKFNVILFKNINKILFLFKKNKKEIIIKIFQLKKFIFSKSNNNKIKNINF